MDLAVGPTTWKVRLQAKFHHFSLLFLGHFRYEVSKSGHVLDSDYCIGLIHRWSFLDSYSVELCESWWRRHGNDQRHVEHGRLLPAGRRAVPRVLATREDRLMAAAGAPLIVGSIVRPSLSTPMHL